MKRWIIGALVLGLLAGCQTKTHKVAKEEAIKRWYNARAEVLCTLGSEHLKVGQLDDATKSAKEAMGLDKDCVNAHVLLGKVYIEQGQYLFATRALMAARDIKPTLAEVHYLLGVAQEKGGDLEAALASYRKALELEPTGTETVVAIGEVLAEMDRAAEALAYVEENLSGQKVAQNQPSIYELAGRLSMMLEDYGKAEHYFQLARDLDYGNACYLELLARAQSLAGKYGPAVESLQKLSTAAAYKDRAWVYLMLGDCLLVLGRASEAREASYKAAELEPNNIVAWANLAKTSLVLRDFHRAMCAAKEALKLDTTNADAAMVLGYVYLHDRQVPHVNEALAVLIVASQAHPQDAMLKCLLGRAYEASGDGDQAKGCYAAVLEVEPGNVLAREFLARVSPERTMLEGSPSSMNRAWVPQ